MSERVRANPLFNFIAGGVGGSLAVSVGHPFDTIKVRVQTMAKPKPGQAAQFNGVIDCLTQTVQKEGFFALYKGMAAPLAGVSPLFALYFLGCSIGKRVQMKHENETLSVPQLFVAGGFAGVLTTIIMVPGERIKVLLQTQGEAAGKAAEYSGPVDVVKKLYKTGGIRSIYRGTIATLARDVPASAAYLGVYEGLRRWFCKLQHTDPEHLSVSSTLVAGGLAGMANWGVCLPQDTLKNRLQSAPDGMYPRGIRDVFRQLVREEGIMALWRGFSPVMLRAFPANAACFMGYELALKSMSFAMGGEP